MGQVKRLPAFGSVLCCVFLSASGVSAQTPSHPGADIPRGSTSVPVLPYRHCTLPLQSKGKITLYYSGVFKVTPNDSISASQNGFSQFLGQKYSVTGLYASPSFISCSSFATEADANKDEQKSIASNRQMSSSDLVRVIVEAGWGNSGAGSTSTATSAPAQPNAGPAAPVSQRYGYCFAQVPSGWYFSAALIGRDLEDGNELGGHIPEAFQNFLTSKYGVGGNVKCQILHSLADAQTYLQRDEESERSYGRNVVATGWVYSGPGSAGAAPSATQSQGVNGGSSVAVATVPAASAPARASANTMPLTTSRTSSPTATAQVAPAPGTTVEVRMIDTVDSSRDPAGKQYRATVTQTVNAGNVTISQGAVATVTLARSGATWVAQLSSLMINGQAVAVASRSATVITTTGITTAQHTAGTVSNAVGGVFGRSPNVPSAAPPVATGDRVVLSPGSRLSFVLAATQ